MSDEKWLRRIERERNARKEAEKLLEEKSLELWNLNQSLEEKVKDRTNALEHALEEAHKANKAKDSFLSSMSHEIRTPLNAIIGFVDIMIRKDFDFEKRNKYLTIIQQSGKNLLRVINDILDFTKLQSGKMQIHNIKVDLRTVLDDNCKLFSAKANDREVNYNYSFSENFPTQFIVDEIRIVQVMNNFISNALKFTPKGEFVNVLINYEKFGSMLTIKVVDTGIGIEKEKHEAIFIPFEQENSGTTRDYGGTGLGLAICVTLINLMGGRLIFKSEKNKGSTFGFSLKVDVPN